jgi:hypothetical protein
MSKLRVQIALRKYALYMFWLEMRYGLGLLYTEMTIVFGRSQKILYYWLVGPVENVKPTEKLLYALRTSH